MNKLPVGDGCFNQRQVTSNNPLLVENGPDCTGGEAVEICGEGIKVMRMNGENGCLRLPLCCTRVRTVKTPP